jgi:hypothetical protein
MIVFQDRGELIDAVGIEIGCMEQKDERQRSVEKPRAASRYRETALAV